MYKAWMIIPGEKPATNGLLFRTEEGAENYARDLLARWFVPTGYEIQPATPEEVERDSSSLGMTARFEPIDTPVCECGRIHT